VAASELCNELLQGAPRCHGIGRFPERRRQAQAKLLFLLFVADEQSLKELCSILFVGKNPVPEKDLAHLREASIFILRNMYQSLLQFL
jgi:hypothetical protein